MPFALILAATLLAVPNSTNGLHVAQTPVTNAEYDRFITETNHRPPRYWKDGKFPNGKENHPVLWVSQDDALAYCKWMTENDPKWSYRLPTAEEWEHAAGPSPSDGFNCNSVVASFYLKTDPNRKVSYVHPKSTEKGRELVLKEVLSVTPDGRIRGWVNHRDHTGFIYTDLFKELNETGGYTTPVDAYAVNPPPRNFRHIFSFSSAP